jgi:hypothetical protein
MKDNTMAQVDDILQHHGVKGMRWGVRKRTDSGRASARGEKRSAKKAAIRENKQESKTNRRNTMLHPVLATKEQVKYVSKNPTALLGGTKHLKNINAATKKAVEGKKVEQAKFKADKESLKADKALDKRWAKSDAFSGTELINKVMTEKKSLKSINQDIRKLGEDPYITSKAFSMGITKAIAKASKTSTSNVSPSGRMRKVIEVDYDTGGMKIRKVKNADYVPTATSKAGQKAEKNIKRAAEIKSKTTALANRPETTPQDIKKAMDKVRARNKVVKGSK